MSGMCCGVVGEAEKLSAPVEPKTSRRRRLEAPPLNLLATDSAAVVQKRQKLNVVAVKNCAPQSGSSEVKVSTGAGDDKEVKSPIKDKPRFGATSVCGRRRDMEDAVAIHPSFSRRGTGKGNSSDVHFFGVYDGHGCSHVAMRCKERFHEIVSDLLKDDGDESSWTELMKNCYSIMDGEVGKNLTNGLGVSRSNCRCELQTPRCDAVGSTAVISLVTPDKLIVSNCGDSRAVLCRNGIAIPLSSDHKVTELVLASQSFELIIRSSSNSSRSPQPDRPDELERIERAGGRVIYWDGARVFGVLAMSRAIGDNYLKPFVIPDPEVRVTDRTSEDECLILASDGLWDVISNETACNVARMCLRSSDSEVSSDKACKDASILLTKLALARESMDNVSVVVVDLRRY